MTSANLLSAVRQQYEDFPYPPRNPADESARLIATAGGNLYAINHFCFRGNRNFGKGFRCLVAGGGTGDCLIFLAEQLRDFDAEIVYLDFSRASREIAEARAKARGLTNITWVTESLLELPRLGLGKFHYINCSGVLHHLDSTEAGLAALTEVLADDGGMYLMLYAKYGRRAVYDMQKLLRHVCPADASAHEKIAITRALLADLPATNLFRRDLDLGRWAHEIAPDGAGDAGLYDLLLHSQDRCFTVAELYRLAAGAGLSMLGFAANAASYDPLAMVRDGEARKRLAALDLPERQAIAELLHHSIDKHEFFLGRDPGGCASLADEKNAVLAFGGLYRNAPKMAAAMAPGRTITYSEQGHELKIRSSPVAQVLFENLKGITPLKNIRIKALKASAGAARKEVDREIQQLFDLLHPLGYLYLLRSNSLGTRIPDYEELVGKCGSMPSGQPEGP